LWRYDRILGVIWKPSAQLALELELVVGTIKKTRKAKVETVKAIPQSISIEK